MVTSSEKKKTEHPNVTDGSIRCELFLGGTGWVVILCRGIFPCGDGMVISGGKHFDDGTAAFSGVGYMFV